MRQKSKRKKVYSKKNRRKRRRHRGGNIFDSLKKTFSAKNLKKAENSVVNFGKSSAKKIKKHVKTDEFKEHVGSTLTNSLENRLMYGGGYVSKKRKL